MLWIYAKKSIKLVAGTSFCWFEENNKKFSINYTILLPNHLLMRFYSFTALIIGLLSVVVTYISATRTIDNFLSKSDLQRLQQIFNDGIKSNDLQTIYYSVINSKKIPSENKESLCKKLPGLHKDSKLNVSIYIRNIIQ